MKKAYIIIAMFLLLPQMANAATFFEKGNMAYRDGDYQLAISLYKQEQNQTAGLLHNMAASYEFLSENGEAMLYYQKAIRLNPRNQMVKAGINRIRQKIGTSPATYMQSSLPITSYEGFILFLLSLIATAILFILRQRQKLSLPPLQISVAINCAMLALFLYSIQLGSCKIYGVAVADIEGVTKNEAEQENAIVTIPAGTELLILKGVNSKTIIYVNSDKKLNAPSSSIRRI